MSHRYSIIVYLVCVWKNDSYPNSLVTERNLNSFKMEPGESSPPGEGQNSNENDSPTEQIKSKLRIYILNLQNWTVLRSTEFSGAFCTGWQCHNVRGPQGRDIFATPSVATISRSPRDAISHISETKFEVYNIPYIADSVAILGIIVRNMPMWQRDRNMAKKFVALMLVINLYIVPSSV